MVFSQLCRFFPQIEHCDSLILPNLWLVDEAGGLLRLSALAVTGHRNFRGSVLHCEDLHARSSRV